MHISAAGVNYSKTAVTLRRTEAICGKQEVILLYIHDGGPFIFMKLLTQCDCRKSLVSVLMDP